MSAIPEGKEVPISLDLGEDTNDKFVRARVFQPDQSQIAQLDLTPRGNGRYSLTGYLMPDFDHIVVQYTVYDDVSYSIPSEFEIASDFFTKNEATGGGGLPEDTIDLIENAINELRRVDIELEIDEQEEVILVAETDGEFELVVEQEDEVLIDVVEALEVDLYVESDNDIVLDTSI
jgi:hypothetical protein